jgi:hypothetical protein
MPDTDGATVMMVQRKGNVGLFFVLFVLRKYRQARKGVDERWMTMDVPNAGSQVARSMKFKHSKIQDKQQMKRYKKI